MKNGCIPDLVALEATRVLPIIEEGEFLKEVEDIIKERNGLLTTSDQCRSAFREYLENPSEEGRHHLKEAYERVPKRLDCWLLASRKRMRRSVQLSTKTNP